MFLLSRRGKLLLVAIALFLSRSASADDWVGRKVMPKSATTLLMSGSQVVGDVTSISWPATIQKANGTWFRVEDDGSMSNPRVAGWIRDDDVIELNLALDYYNGRLLDGPEDGGLYWLRGICWESQGDFQMARLDYASAVKHSSYLAYAHSALARTMSKTGAKAEECAAEFNEAKRLNPSHPRLYWDWGQAVEATSRDVAKQHYTTATTLSPQWWQPYYSLGLLAGNAQDYPTSLEKLREAIRRNPWAYHAYRDRARFHLAELKRTKMTLSPEDLTDVLASANRACQLCYYRNAESLEVLADAFASMKSYDVAKHYQQMAVEQAGLAAKARHLKKWHEYNAAATETQVASTQDDVRRREFNPGASNESSSAPRSEQPVFVDRSGFSLP